MDIIRLYKRIISMVFPNPVTYRMRNSVPSDVCRYIHIIDNDIVNLAGAIMILPGW